MKILFVWPNKDQFGFKPMGISLLSAILKQAGHQVELFDTTFIDFGFSGNTEVRQRIKIFKDVDFSGYNIKKKPLDLKKTFHQKLESFQPDLLAFSVLSDEVALGRELSRLAKEWKKEVPVLWGNKAVTMAPSSILQDKNIDYACVGEAIEFLPEFVRRMEQGLEMATLPNLAYRCKNGEIKVNPLKDYYQQLDKLPFFDWSIFDQRQFLKPYDGKVYRGGDHMLFWGCPNRCTYCINEAYRQLYGKKAGTFLRHYSVGRIIAELAQLVKEWQIEFFKFHDEDFCLKPMPFFQELAEAYAREIKVPFTIMANAKNIDAAKVRLLKKMNCVSVTLGIETGNDELRKNILLRRETREDIIAATRLLNQAGIRTSAFNMLGIPFENRKTVMETIALNRAAEVRYPNAGFFFPLEGTALRQIAIENGFYSAENGRVFQNDMPTLKFKDISEEELVALRERFALYVKMPEQYYKYIERSEKNDPIGQKLTAELYHIYQECVFAHDGVWNDGGRLEEHLCQLRSIISQGSSEVT